MIIGIRSREALFNTSCHFALLEAESSDVAGLNLICIPFGTTEAFKYLVSEDTCSSERTFFSTIFLASKNSREGRLKALPPTAGACRQSVGGGVSAGRVAMTHGGGRLSPILPGCTSV